MDQVTIPAALLAFAPVIAGVVQLLKRLGWVDAYPKLTALVLSLVVSIAWTVRGGALTDETLSAAVLYGVALSAVVMTSGAVLTYEAIKPLVQQLASNLRAG